MPNHAKKSLVTSAKPAKLGRAGFQPIPTAMPRLELTRLEPEQALSILHPAADKGNAQAAYMLSLIYEGAGGVVRDEQAAAHWFARAAELDAGGIAAQLAKRCGELLEAIAADGEALAHGSPAPESRRHAEGIQEKVDRLRSIIARLAELAARKT